MVHLFKFEILNLKILEKILFLRKAPPDLIVVKVFLLTGGAGIEIISTGCLMYYPELRWQKNTFNLDEIVFLISKCEI